MGNYRFSGMATYPEIIAEATSRLPKRRKKIAAHRLP
jgi:hypothetical protein